MKYSRIIFSFTIFSLFFMFSGRSQHNPQEMKPTDEESTLTLFLAGDVMTARGIDQALPTSVEPVLYESYVKDARDYLTLAERVSGDIPENVSYKYIWGDALEVWNKISPDLKLINLETSITTYEIPWPGKGIHYRMHPENVQVLTAAGIDHCSLANNHTLDWHRPGLLETMKTLGSADIKFSGAGINESEAEEASVFRTQKGKVAVFSYGSRSSGIPKAWAATEELSGVNLLPGLGDETVEEIKKKTKPRKEAGEIVVFSVHWGGNWGYNIAEEQKDFAHKLIDEAGVDIVFGHSSHHPMGIEVYNEKLIIYGAGDFINDYEGISGHEQYRGELTFMYFPKIDPQTGNLVSLKLVPMEIEKFRLNYAKTKDAQWLANRLSREGEQLGTSVNKDKENNLWLDW